MAKKQSKRKLTLAHVTHEAVEQLGGIGTVLEGLMTSPKYKQRVGRSILVGPCNAHLPIDPDTRLGDHGKVLYSSVDGIDRANVGARLRPIEWAFNAPIVYGTRSYAPPGTDRTGDAEVLLIDIFNPNQQRLNALKHMLWEGFGLDCNRYEADWGFEEYARLAEPAYYALLALLSDEELPCVMFSHEFMGIAAALHAVKRGRQHFRTIFHAHECSTARSLVEDHPGHDVMFYNAMRQAKAKKLYAPDVFGDLDHYFRHALVSRTHHLDGIIAVGDHTAEELHFLDKAFDDHPIELVYNGMPAPEIDFSLREKSRGMLLEYSKLLVGHTPDFIMTHVARPVISKGMWRNFAVCDALEPMLKEKGQRAVLYILTSAGGVRSPEDVARMDEEYDWPRHHREGFPDLVGPETGLAKDAEAFNQTHEHVQVILVNQFGWSRDRIGQRVPKDMDMGDFRRATDVEFGMATYEPFGISPLEPLHSGAVCVISTVCGCAGFVNATTDGKAVDNVLIADYTHMDKTPSLKSLLNMTQAQRDAVEGPVSRQLAKDLFERLPKTKAQREKLFKSGQKLAAKMGWDQIAESGLLPMLDRVLETPEKTG